MAAYSPSAYAVSAYSVGAYALDGGAVSAAIPLGLDGGGITFAHTRSMSLGDVSLLLPIAFDACNSITIEDIGDGALDPISQFIQSPEINTTGFILASPFVERLHLINSALPLSISAKAELVSIDRDLQDFYLLLEAA